MEGNKWSKCLLFGFWSRKYTNNCQTNWYDKYLFISLKILIDIIGDAGGNFGLMLGASLLTFVEFVDLFIFLLYHQLLRLQKRKSFEKKQNEEQELKSFLWNNFWKGHEGKEQALKLSKNILKNSLQLSPWQ